MLYQQVEEREQKHIGGVTTVTGACRFCGQVATRKALEEWGNDEIDELITETCDCPEADNYAFKKQQKETADEQIEKLFGTGKRDLEVPEAVADLLHKAVHPIREGCIASVTIDAGNGVKGRINMTTKGNIKVTRTKTDTSAYEA